MRIAVNAVRKFYRNRKLQFWRQMQHASVDSTAMGNRLPDNRISPESSTLIQEQVRAVWAKHGL